MERLGVETVDNYSKYLPWVEADIAVVDDNENNDLVTYLIVTNYTEGDRTITDRDKLYDKLIWNNPINYDSFVEYKNLNKYYIHDGDIMFSRKNKLYRLKIRLLFDDMG